MHEDEDNKEIQLISDSILILEPKSSILAYLHEFNPLDAGIPVLRNLQNGAKPRYTGSVQISLHRQTPVYRVYVNI